MRRRKRKHSIMLLALSVTICFIVVAFMKRMVISSEEVSPEWNLILVNKEHFIPNDWDVEFTELTNGKKVDSRIYPKLQEMFNDARAVGLGLYVAEGYRTESEQREMLDEKISYYENDGYSRYEARKLAKQWVAVPGTSEHQLGIAVDINADKSVSSDEAVYTWLAQNSYKYGFINRYPADKKEITGIIYEPWHYRYVGEQAAREMYSQGLCLEEYLEVTGNETLSKRD